ncbi:MAG: SBBP repeat-containing protein [Thermoplasmatales archaeon]|nr:MAG: SBBP repeat-containing protein [Thermoplasmatales archaeon]
MKKIISLKILGILVMVMLITTALPVLGQINQEKTINQALADPNWEWAISGGGTSLDYGHNIATDKNGNCYVIGKYFFEATFGTTTLINYGTIKNNDIFVAKINSNGEWQWAVGAGGTFNDEGNGIAVDDEGNVYITGIIYDTAWFGNITLTCVGYQDVYVAKLDTDGNWLWAIRGGSHPGEGAYGISLDSFGNIYITGHFMYRTTFGETTLESKGSADVFVAKLDNEGNWLWASSGGGSLADYPNDIVVDYLGNSYIVGDFDDDASFGSYNITHQDHIDVFIAKLDTDGNWQWAKSGVGDSTDRGYNIAVDSNGDVRITGTFFVSITFGTTTLTSLGEWDVYVVKLDTNGDFLWVTQGGGTSSDSGRSITVDYNKNSYITGTFNGEATFGASTITSLGFRDVYVAKLDDDGNWQWAMSAGGVEYDQGYGIAVDNNGYIYNTGYFDGISAFGTTTLTTEGEYDVFIAKVLHDDINSPPDAPTIDGPNSGKPGRDYEYTFNSIDENEDSIMYIIEWGDNNTEWTEYGNSGEDFILTHSWNEDGEYTIKAKAKDIHDAESNWAYFDVTIPRNRVLQNPFFIRLLEWFSNSFPFFLYIYGLLD